MTSRDQDLLALRPTIDTANVALAANPVEAFQHATLRPILKLQNDLLVLAFRQYAQKRKFDLTSPNSLKRQEFIRQAIQKDQRCREWLFGLVAGQFTLSEWEQYATFSTDVRKRLTLLLIQRLIDQLT